MGYRGVHFAITDDEESRILSAKDDEAVYDVVESIEEKWDKEHLQETDKAWDGIHRALTDGKLEFENGEYPFKRCILGGRQLYEGDDYVVSYLPRSEVSDVANAIVLINKSQLRELYKQINPSGYYFEVSEEDFEYIWSWFKPLKGFFKRAADDNRPVIFAVDL